MKVKDLKELLNRANGEAEIEMTKANGQKAPSFYVIADVDIQEGVPVLLTLRLKCNVIDCGKEATIHVEG